MIRPDKTNEAAEFCSTQMNNVPQSKAPPITLDDAQIVNVINYNDNLILQQLIKLFVF